MQKVLRGRLVNFRVTDEEFEQIKIACDRQGATCISAFARKIMLSVPDASKEEVASQLSVLERRLTALEVSLSRLFSAMALSSADVNSLRNQK